MDEKSGLENHELSQQISAAPGKPRNELESLVNEILPSVPVQSSGASPTDPPRVEQPIPHAATPSDLSGEGPSDIGAFKIALLGGKQTGKSYLFQAMLYRTYGVRSGVLSNYLGGRPIGLHRALRSTDLPQGIDPEELITAYRQYARLPQTQMMSQYWYRLHLPYRAGWLGGRDCGMDLHFVDGAGERLAAPRSYEDPEMLPYWRTFLEARVAIFCLPLWAAFPRYDDLTPDDLREREKCLLEFRAVVQNLRDVRQKYAVNHPVVTIMALTMADDKRCVLHELKGNWIEPFLHAPRRYLDGLRSGPGIMRYLASARRVSLYVRECFEAAAEQGITGLPGLLEFGGGPAWLIPMMAIDGAELSVIENQLEADTIQRLRRKPPEPAHVELPLLVALCEEYNALM